MEMENFNFKLSAEIRIRQISGVFVKIFVLLEFAFFKIEIDGICLVPTENVIKSLPECVFGKFRQFLPKILCVII